MTKTPTKFMLKTLWDRGLCLLVSLLSQWGSCFKHDTPCLVMEGLQGRNCVNRFTNCFSSRVRIQCIAKQQYAKAGNCSTCHFCYVY